MVDPKVPHRPTAPPPVKGVDWGVNLRLRTSDPTSIGVPTSEVSGVSHGANGWTGTGRG